MSIDFTKSQIRQGNRDKLYISDDTSLDVLKELLSEVYDTVKYEIANSPMPYIRSELPIKLSRFQNAPVNDNETEIHKVLKVITKYFI
jgi:hypothetical protein